MKNTITTRTLPGFLNERGIGFDRMFDLLDEAVSYTGTTAYPPYNLIKITDDEFVVEVALAGFTMEDLEITQNARKLTIEGHKPEIEGEEVTYLHRGISSRAFTRDFVLAEHVDVKEAKFDNGILRITLRREVPEEMKPRQIAIQK
jgi:molecular chaperone IbpA